MTRARAFLISAGITAAVITPIFAIAGLFAMTRVQEADTLISGISVLSPTAADKKTVLVMTGSGSAQTASTAAVVHFDALNSRLTCFAAPMNTVVLADGKPLTLSDAAASAGPSQCAAALSETLGIEIDNYLYATPQVLCNITQNLSNAQIKLRKYLPTVELNKLQLVLDGIDTQVMTPYMLYEVLDACEASPNIQQLRADGYLAFLTADASLLQDALTPALKKYIGSAATDITATDIQSYDRIFKFFKKEEPQLRQSAVLPGTLTQNGTYELLPEAAETAQRLCNVTT